MHNHSPFLASSLARENLLTRDFHDFRVIIFIIIIFRFFSKPAISLPEPVEALNVSPNVSTVNGGVHGHRAIVLLQPYIHL